MITASPAYVALADARTRLGMGQLTQPVRLIVQLGQSELSRLLVKRQIV